MHKTTHFTWLGINKDGFKITGEIRAQNMHTAHALLLQKKITPLKIRRVWQFSLLSKKNHIKEADITAFSREFSTLITSGIPLLQSLRILEESAQKKSMQYLIGDIAKQVENGCTFSAALQSHILHFGTLFYHLIQAGEYTGMLDSTLQQLALYREKIATFRKKIKKALLYPCFICAVALCVAAAMLLYVLPQFARLFQDIGAELPALTRMMIQSAAQLHQHASSLFCIFFALLFSFRIGIQRIATWQIFSDRFLLGCPLIGKMVRASIYARCFRTLSSSLQAGIPLLDALPLVAQISHNHVYHHAFINVAQHIQNGHSLYFAFKNTALFSIRVIHMIRIGEESGRVEEMLHTLSDYFEAQLHDNIENGMQLLEPMLMLFLCCFIGLFVIAMYLPIFRIGTVL